MPAIRVFILALMTSALGGVAFAQTPVATADLAKLETTAGDIDRQIGALRATQPAVATESARALADLRDEIAYLRVTMRRDGRVAPAQYSDVRERLDALRSSVEGWQRVYAQPVIPPDETVSSGLVAVGTELDVRMQTPLNSGTTRVEQRFEATTLVDFRQGGSLLIPAGSIVRGFVSSVRPAGRIDRTGSLTLSFDQIVIRERTFPLRASIVQALDPKEQGDLTRIGAGAAIGAIIGGVLGGAKGALVGVLIGGGGTIASSEGADVDLPPGTILRIRIDQPLETRTPR
jgi:hypothetical protein